jgi:polyhydroxybutyrate depolymerase
MMMMTHQMTRLTTLLAAITVAIGNFACSGSPQQLPSTRLVVDGLERQYNLFVPTNQPDGPMPLLVAVHGGGGQGETFPQQAQFESLAEAAGIVIAFPQAHQMSGNEGEWQLNTRPGSHHDIDYIAAMIDAISATHSIDSSRVYATGYSLGSMFTYELACHMSDRFAAIASFAGTMPVAMHSCAQARAVPIMHIHGVEDSIIAYGDTWDWKAWDSVGRMMDIPSLMAFWRNQYNCQTENTTAGPGTTHFVQSMCDQDARLEHHRLDGVGHGWPDAIDGVSTHQVIWSFLSGFSRELNLP